MKISKLIRNRPKIKTIQKIIMKKSLKKKKTK